MDTRKANFRFFYFIMDTFFKTKIDGDSLTSIEQEAFIKLMIEDKMFRNNICLCLDKNFIDGIKFNPHELGDIVRVIRNMNAAREEISYKNVYGMITPNYDTRDINKEISLEIIKTVLENCQKKEFGKLEVWKNMFLDRIGKLADDNYDDSKSWISRRKITPGVWSV